MTASSLQFGSEIASELRVRDTSREYIAEKFTSLQGFLDASHGRLGNEHAMLRSTAARLTEYFKMDPAQISLDIVSRNRSGFRDYLRSMRLKKNSVRSYSNYVNILLVRAKELGWKEAPVTVPAVWTPVLEQVQAAPVHSRCIKLLRFLVDKALTPATVQESDFAEWAHLEAKKGTSFSKTRGRIGRMRRILVETEHNSNLRTDLLHKTSYGVRFEDLPDTLRAELKDVLRWKQDRFVPSRPKGAQIRPITAYRLELYFRNLYGFATSVQGVEGITCLRELVTEQIVGGYIMWNLNERGIKNASAAISVYSIYAALAHNIKYAPITDEWMVKLINSIPEDDDESRRLRKEEKYVSYSKLCEVLDKIRKDRARIPTKNVKEIALSVRNELMIQWLLVLPWRQRNIRECRIGGPTPNLFRASVSRTASITKPDWLVRAERENDVTEAWQVRFSSSETKTHHEVHCILPSRLIPLLEEYLSVHRPVLVTNNDSGTLFVSEVGSALTTGQVRHITASYTLKYCGKTVTPHLFRDIFAYMWLELAPEDYLTLSKLLWHRNINTTINIYGKRFNESAALCRMERMLPG
jgi:integrase